MPSPQTTTSGIVPPSYKVRGALGGSSSIHHVMAGRPLENYGDIYLNFFIRKGFDHWSHPSVLRSVLSMCGRTRRQRRGQSAAHGTLYSCTPPAPAVLGAVRRKMTLETQY